MEVRIATSNDVDDLFELNTLFENTTTIEQMKKALTENDREVVCIAFIDGIAVGYCCGLIVKSMCYSENRADIETLYVKAEYRKQGVGKALMTYLESVLKEFGIFHFHINTYSTNIDARLLYESLGYKKTGEIVMDKSIELP